MKKMFLIACLMLASLSGQCQFLVFLDKGDIFTSPETDMVVMDKYSFAKYHYAFEKYDTLKREVLHYDSLLDAKDSAEKQLRADYQKEIASKDLQVKIISESYQSLKTIAQESIDQQNKLQAEYLKLEKKNRRAKRWRNFFIGTTAVLGAVIYIVVR